MKKIVFTLIAIGMFYVGFAQGINFQGVARSANGTIIAGSNVSLRLSIISKNVDATPEFVETKTVMTNAQGIFSIVVGDGSNTAVVGNFKNIVWSDGPKFLKVEMDPAGGTNYLNMGATQLQYVPYAYYSYGVAASNVSGVLSIDKGGTGVTTIAALKDALNLSSTDSSMFSKKDINLNGKIIGRGNGYEVTNSVFVSKYVPNDNELNIFAVWNRNGILKNGARLQTYLGVDEAGQLFVHFISGFSEQPADKDYLIEINYGSYKKFHTIKKGEYKLERLGQYEKGKSVEVYYQGK